MKPPEVIYVGAADVAVKVTKHIQDGLAGDFSESGRIKLLKGMTPALERDTLLHEALHAIIYLAGIRKALDFTHEQEEKLVVTLTPWILALLRDNPKLVQLLLENREREY